MPRGQKSKLRARERRNQARAQTRGLQDAQATAPQEGESPSCTSTVPGDAAGLLEKSPGAPPTSAAVVRKRSGKGAKGRGQQGAESSKAPPSAKSSQEQLLVRKAEMLLQYLMCKYKTKEPILRKEMLKIVHKRFREQFPDIFKIACMRMELVFGLEVNEAKPGGSSFTLVNILDLPDDRNLGLPRTGLLLSLLGIIYLCNYSAAEKDVWEFLSCLGVCDNRQHFVFGDVKKLITEDLVQEKYVEYRQVPGSDPPSYQFLWGSRAHEENTKMKVLQFLAKVTTSDAYEFPPSFKEALRNEKKNVQARVAATSRVPAQASPGPGATSSLSTPK